MEWNMMADICSMLIIMPCRIDGTNFPGPSGEGNTPIIIIAITSIKESEAKQIAMKKDNTVLESSMHGFWYGSVDNFKYEVASIKCLPRPAQMFRDSRYLLSATSPLDRIKVVLQVQTNLASTLSVVKNIWKEGRLLAFFRGTSMVIENWGSGSFFWLRRPSPNPSLRAAMQRAIVDCTGLVFTAAASNLCAKRQKNDSLM